MSTEMTQEESDRCVRALKFYACRVSEVSEANAADDLANKLRGVESRGVQPLDIGFLEPRFKEQTLGRTFRPTPPTGPVRVQNFQIQMEAVSAGDLDYFMRRMTKQN